MTETSLHRWTASDGVELAFHEMGEGRALILLHGLFSSAEMNWIRFGHAERIASEGFRLIMPDLRAHGRSGKPHDPDSYPDGVLARDLSELVEHLGLDSFDLGGFSLGARTTVEAVGEGLRPGKAIIAGMGLQGLQRWAKRKRFFLEAIDRFDTAARGDPHWLAIQFMNTMAVDREAAALLLDSFTDCKDGWLEAFEMPTLVLLGSEDRDNGSGEDLASALPEAVYREVPGTHMSSVTKPEFGSAIAEFLAASA
jgi:pimeloyl-ACP methyl ester carboxylesterase